MVILGRAGGLRIPQILPDRKFELLGVQCGRTYVLGIEAERAQAGTIYIPLMVPKLLLLVLAA